MTAPRDSGSSDTVPFLDRDSDRDADADLLPARRGGVTICVSPATRRTPRLPKRRIDMDNGITWRLDPGLVPSVAEWEPFLDRLPPDRWAALRPF